MFGVLASDVMWMSGGYASCAAFCGYGAYKKNESERKKVCIPSILDTEHVFGVMCTDSCVNVGGEPGGFECCAAVGAGGELKNESNGTYVSLLPFRYASSRTD